MKPGGLVLIVALLGIAALACSDRDADRPPVTAPAGGATGTATAVPGSPTPGASPSPTAPRADGTIDPLNPGATERVTVKASPDPFPGQALLKAVRMGVHPEQGGWERIVFEFDATGLPPATIGYVTSATQCGSGQAVALPGQAILEVRVEQAANHDEAGRISFPQTTLRGPGNTILEARQTCDFEGVVTWHLGMKGKQNFKVTKLERPNRLVIDVKQ